MSRNKTIQARLRISQQVIAGLLKDRSIFSKEISEIAATYDWAKAQRDNCQKEIERIDKIIETIRKEFQ